MEEVGRGLEKMASWNTIQNKSIDLNGDSVYDWVKGLKRFWESLLHLAYFVVTSTADYAVEIAARAIAIAAPLPNAISVYKITQESLGFNSTQAWAFSIVIEVAVFALVEFSLYLFDGYLRHPKKWTVPFFLSVVSVVVGVAIVIGFVYRIELVGQGHTIMAWLPVISLCAFMSIGLKRWHDRQPEISGIKTISVKKTPSKLASKLASKMTPTPVNNVDFDAFDANSSAKTDAMSEGKKRKVDAGADALYEILRDEFNGQPADTLNKAELGRRIGKSRGTVGNYLEILENRGSIELNGKVKVV